VFFSVGEDLARGRKFGPGITGVTIAFDLQGTVDLAVRLQPSARHVVVVAGAAEYDKYWVPLAAAAVGRHPGLETTFLTGQPLDGMLRDVRAIPSDSIVICASFTRDGAGQPFLSANVAEQVAEASPAPVYGFFEVYLGRGIVAGSISTFEAQGRRAAELALRVLNGEKAEAIPVQPPPPSEPVADWQQLQKLGLSEASLPAGSRILFRPRTLWEEYRGIAAGILVVLGIQTALIVALVVQNRRRRRAQFEAQRQRVELAHALRLTVIGELTASIAHEINQPLGAILSYAEAAEMLTADTPGLDQVRQILAEIRHEDLRASDVIQHVRTLANKVAPEMLPVDVNDVVHDAFRMMDLEATRRRIDLSTEMLPDRLAVKGVRVQLQQVVLNLILNGMEALAETTQARRILVRTTRNGRDVQVAVSDTGPGIDPEALSRLFESFFTTKKEGMGLGLSIARSIVEAHDGRIWAENNLGGGATFCIALPAAVS
jgi:signal transduction histidine kinase